MHMKKKYYTSLLVVLLLVLATGCSTQLGLGFGFGSGGNSISLGIRTTLPREERVDIWAMQGSALPKERGERVSITFPKGGTAQGKVWGTDLYADTSTIGMAAVHSGIITFEDGGSVLVQREAESASFVGSVRHGVESLSLDTSSGAFSFVIEDLR